MAAHNNEGSKATHYDIRELSAVDPDFAPALRRVFNLDPAVPSDLVLDRFMGQRRRTPCADAPPDFLLGAYCEGCLVSACLTWTSPGAAAMVMIPSRMRHTQERFVLSQLLRTVQERAWKQGIMVLEVLVEADSPDPEASLREADFRYLTRLMYFRRPIVAADREQAVSPGIEWVSYTPEVEPLFTATLDQTYTQSMDCPELTGIRTTAQVLAGHRAVGVFDPALWWIAKREGQPVGLILLNRCVHDPLLEVVYVGVVCSARGTGVADALLSRAVGAASRVNVRDVALAVDGRNTPARRLYGRWGFVQTGERGAWIACAPRVHRD